MTALYNENDPFVAAWLRNLITAGHIATGDVDERSIADLRAVDLVGRAQCHFFAGIGVWSHALRLAGVPDDASIWTGSCPCQPFSAAGTGGGFDDPRHLWPAWFALIRECRPAVIFGEQVASPAGLAWFDLVHADLEGAGYAVGAADLCSASVGAPHMRQRLHFVACADEARPQGRGINRDSSDKRTTRPSGVADQLAHTDVQRREGQRVLVQPGQPRPTSAQAGGRSEACELGNTGSPRGRWDTRAIPCTEDEGASEGRRVGSVADVAVSPSATDFWSACDWIPCTDGKCRPVEPGTFPLAHGAAARVGRLRAYGNAINAEVAATFIRAAIGAA